MITITPRALAMVRREALAARPAECCGVLCAPREQPDDIAGIWHLENVADNPESRFETRPDDLLSTWQAIENYGRVVRVVFHSHVHAGPELSQTDLKMAPPDAELLHLVYSVRDDRFGLWRVADGAAEQVEYKIDCQECGFLSPRT
jgi:proteasome lid subunit RPN8/RPN11